MGSWKSKSERKNVSEWKATVWAKQNTRYFVESDSYIARQMSELAKRPVICPPDGKIYGDTYRLDI